MIAEGFTIDANCRESDIATDSLNMKSSIVKKGIPLIRSMTIGLGDEQPVLEAFGSWAEKQIPTKGLRFAKAIDYVLNRKDYLMT